MRRLLYIIIGVIILCVVSTSCENKALNRQLDDLDTLMRVSPDSVYAVLDSMDTRQMSKRQRMRHALLLADAQNKAYIDFTTDSAMLEVSDYFDHHGTPNEQMRAHYLLGCTYRDMGDVPMELQCFLDATEKADTTDRDCDLYTLYAIYGQMADIYHSQYLQQEELRAHQMCERIAWIDKDTLSAIQSYALQARTFDLIGENDSIIKYIHQAYDNYLSLKDTINAARLLGPIISIHIEQNKWELAKEEMNTFEKLTGYFDSNGEIKDISTSSYYYDKGMYLLHLEKLDSAKVFFTKLLSYNHKEAAYKGLFLLYERTNQPDSTSKYAKLFTSANDSSYVGKNTEAVSQMTAMYDYTRHQQIAKQKTIENANTKKLVYIISMVATIILFAAIILYGYLRNKNKERERLYLSQEKTLLKRYNETKEIIAELEKEMASLEIQKEEASVANKSHIEELILAINNYEKEKEELVSKLKGFSQINEDLDFKAWYEDFIVCDATKKLRTKTIVKPNTIIT